METNYSKHNETLGKSVVLIGLQYGDEGKGRVLDVIIPNYQIVARFNGGPNAGHSLEVGNRKIALHQIPSGIFYPNQRLYIGSGCVINPEKLNQEIAEVASLGKAYTSHGVVDFSKVKERIIISSQTPLIQPHHIILDGILGKVIGTTKNGIGPAYADRAMRAEGNSLEDYRIKSVKIGEYLLSNHARTSVLENLEQIISLYAEKYPEEFRGINPKALEKIFYENVQKISNNVSFDPLFLEKRVSQGESVIFEGAQSIMLDRDKGVGSFVTSSTTLAAGAYTGGDLSMKYHSGTIGVAKAIMSRVGNGPFVSEFGGEQSERYCAEGDGLAHRKEVEFSKYNPQELLASGDLFKIGIALRMIEGEYGATTKRPRRRGMLDLVMLKQNCLLNAVDKLYINKFDCLSTFSKTPLPGIPIVTAYELDGKTIDYIPTTVEESRRVKPVIQYFPHIDSDISGARKKEDLPAAAKNLIDFIERFCQVPLYGIGVGPEREQFVNLR